MIFLMQSVILLFTLPFSKMQYFMLNIILSISPVFFGLTGNSLRFFLASFLIELNVALSSLSD